MAFLLDTNIVSEVRKPRPDARVTAWLASVEGDDLFPVSYTHLTLPTN